MTTVWRSGLLVWAFAVPLASLADTAQDFSGEWIAATKDQQAQPPKDAKEITATVVAADPVLKTITVKKEPAMGQQGTQPDTIFPVEEKAIANLKTIKAGEKVKLVLKMDPASGKETVSSVEKPKTPY
jgi:Cu/Ag efflux protein CusF